jgi:hypothetical protein
MVRPGKEERTRMLRAVVVVAMVATLVACGGDPASKAYGKMTERDRAALTSFSQAIGEFNADLTVLRAALGKDDLGEARTRVDALSSPLDQAEAATLEFDNGRLRSTLQDYVTNARGVHGTVDHWVSYWEDESQPRDQALEQQMLTEMQAAGEKFKAADQALLNHMLDSASAEERQEIRQAVKRAQDR